MNDEKNNQSESFEAALLAFEAEQSETMRRPLRIGESAAGTIVSIDDDTAFVELGGKAEGQVATSDLRDADGALKYAVGDTIEALIAATRDDGAFVLRMGAGQGPVAGEELRAAHQLGLPVEGRVCAVNKGGVEVEVGGLRAFCPISQLADRFVEDPAEFLERKLEFRVTRFEDAAPGRRPNIVLSRRALLEEEKKRLAEEARKKVQVGAVLLGEVRSVVSFGAFIDLGGLEGLLHVSEMSHGRVEDPSTVVSVGQQLKVEVLKIEPDPKGKGERISLSIRTLQQDPWSGVAQQFPIGTTVPGRVQRVESFGAFVEVAPGIDGLVHISELGASERVQHARDVVSPGQEVEVKVIDLDLTKRRLALSIAAAKAEGVARSESADRADFERRNVAGSGGLGSLAEQLSRAQKRTDEDND